MGTRKRAPKAHAKRVESKETVLFTGFPGFIGARLIPRLLELQPDTTFICLVQEKFLPPAQGSDESLAEAHPQKRARLGLVLGAITARGPASAETERRTPRSPL